MATPAFGKLEEESSNSGASEEVLDHIDGVFDGEYEELTGRAAADYIPLEKDEIFLKKGDPLTITEQTLDGHSFLVLNQRTGEHGRIPIEFIDINPEDVGEIGKRDHDGMESDHVRMELDHTRTESSLDTSPFQRKPGIGIVRRPGVSRAKASRFRREYRITSDDKEKLINDLSPNGEGEDTREPPPTLTSQSGLSRPPGLSSQAKSASMSMAHPPGDSPKRLDRPKTFGHDVPWDVAASMEQTRRPTRGLGQQREVRAQTVSVPTQFKLVEKYNILSVSGADRDGRPVVVFSACRLPPVYQINHQILLEYLLYTLDQYVEMDYTLVYFHYGLSSINKPSLTWLRQVYKELDRKYKKNLKKLYIVHPTGFIRAMMWLFKPFISYKFGRKVAYINRLDELRPVLFLDQIDIPENVKRYDATLKAPVRNVAQTDSRSTFHMPLSPEEVSPAAMETKQFGVPLHRLQERNDGDPIPVVLRTCVEYLEINGVNVLGIFRRTPSNAMVHHIKAEFDRGENVDFATYGDPHLAAVVMKLFLRELPEPLLTFQAYQTITELRGKPEASKVAKCKEIIASLPPTNYEILKYLITFLNKVKEHEEQNKMSSVNLAIVFGPNLIWSQSEAASLASLGDINTFTVLLINKFDEFFSE